MRRSRPQQVSILIIPGTTPLPRAVMKSLTKRNNCPSRRELNFMRGTNKPRDGGKRTINMESIKLKLNGGREIAMLENINYIYT